MTSRIRCCTWIAMAAAACSAGAQAGARSGCTEAATLSARLTFAEQARAKRILSHRDAWVKQLSKRNSSYIIHPEELLADNFATLMEWRAEGNVPARNPGGDAVDDVRLLTAIRDALLADCGQ